MTRSSKQKRRMEIVISRTVNPMKQLQIINKDQESINLSHIHLAVLQDLADFLR